MQAIQFEIQNDPKNIPALVKIAEAAVLEIPEDSEIWLLPGKRLY